MPNGRPQKDPRPIPKVPDLDCQSYTSEDALVHDIIEGLRNAGLCVVRQMLKPDILAKIRAEMKPHVPQAATTPGQFRPRETKKISSMLSKSETYALHLVGHPVWQRVGEYFLTSTLEKYWVNNTHSHPPPSSTLSNLPPNIQRSANREPYSPASRTATNSSPASPSPN